jgi:hypothetical protein
MSNTLFRVTCEQFTGGFVINEDNEVIYAAPFLTRFKGLKFNEVLHDLIQWNGVIIERVSPGKEPNIPKGTPKRATYGTAQLID